MLTDNGNQYRSPDFLAACAARGISPRRTRHYRPQTNGKAERFIRTLLGEWAYARLFETTAQRSADLPGYLDF